MVQDGGVGRGGYRGGTRVWMRQGKPKWCIGMGMREGKGQVRLTRKGVGQGRRRWCPPFTPIVGMFGMEACAKGIIVL